MTPKILYGLLTYNRFGFGNTDYWTKCKSSSFIIRSSLISQVVFMEKGENEQAAQVR